MTTTRLDLIDLLQKPPQSRPSARAHASLRLELIRYQYIMVCKCSTAYGKNDITIGAGQPLFRVSQR